MTAVLNKRFSSSVKRDLGGAYELRGPSKEKLDLVAKTLVDRWCVEENWSGD